MPDITLDIVQANHTGYFNIVGGYNSEILFQTSAVSEDPLYSRTVGMIFSGIPSDIYGKKIKTDTSKIILSNGVDEGGGSVMTYKCSIEDSNNPQPLDTDSFYLRDQLEEFTYLDKNVELVVAGTVDILGRKTTIGDLLQVFLDKHGHSKPTKVCFIFIGLGGTGQGGRYSCDTFGDANPPQLYIEYEDRPNKKVTIQNALIDAFLEGPYFNTSYTSGQKVVLGELVKPKGLFVNEVTSDFGLDAESRRVYRQVKNSWTFVCGLEFIHEVVLNEFEDTLLKSPIKITYEEDTYIALVSDVKYDHPITQQPERGTRAIYTLQINQFRQE